MLRRVIAFCRLLRPVLLLVLFPRSRSPVIDVLGLCWLRQAPFMRKRCPVVAVPVVAVPGLFWLLQGSFDGFCYPHTSAQQSSTTCLTAFPCS